MYFVSEPVLFLAKAERVCLRLPVSVSVFVYVPVSVPVSVPVPVSVSVFHSCRAGGIAGWRLLACGGPWSASEH